MYVRTYRGNSVQPELNYTKPANRFFNWELIHVGSYADSAESFRAATVSEKKKTVTHHWIKKKEKKSYSINNWTTGFLITDSHFFCIFNSLAVVHM